MIKAVIFDYFGVLASDNYWEEVHIKARQSGNDSVIKKLVEDMDNGLVDWQKFCVDIAKQTGTTAEQVNQKCHDLNFSTELLPYIKGLKNRGIKIGLLSNASAGYLLPILETSGIKSLFDVITVSSEVGHSKPHPEMYTKILQKLGVQANEAVMIDDSPVNVDGAIAVGMHGICFFNLAQVTREMNNLLTT